MSASKKKKLRSEESGKLTERQRNEQKEAKKVKVYSIAFVAVLVLMIGFAIGVGVNRSIESSGVREKNTVAVTIGEHELSSAEFSYYYIDYINNFANNYGSYLSYFGLDTSKTLDEQVYDEESGITWADEFIEEAASSAKSVLALADAAEAEGFTLPEEEQSQVDLLSSNLDSYATLYGYSNTNAFLKAQYGNGASKDSYLEYYSRNLLATAYQSAHEDSLTYTDEQIRAADDEDPTQYSSYSFAQYYIATSKYLTGGTTDEDGNTTYTAAERESAVEAAREAIEPLTEASSLDELNEAIAAMEINADTEASATECTDYAKSSINSNFRDWVTDASRKEGDITCVEVAGTATDENGEEIDTVSGFYVVFYIGENDNKTELINVRHILVSFDGDQQDDGTYSDEVKEAALASAEEILSEWQSGDATEESFAELANSNSSDSGSNTNGGLYENVYPGQMVSAFNDWCFDASRKAGDTGIVETSYGYHVMYFVGTTGQTYRDYQITNDLKDADMNSWTESLLENYTITVGDTSYMRKDITLSSSN